MRSSKLIALLMIYLVISLTFFSSLVFASIFKAEAYGDTDKVPGITRSDDTLVINTRSTMKCSVKADFTNNTYESMTCIQPATAWECTYTHPITNVTGKVSATVKEDVSQSEKNVEAYVDNLGPKISSFTPTSLKNKVKASYAITDQANQYFLNKCSGIEKVELILNRQVINTTNHLVGQCSVSGFLIGTIPNFIGKVNASLKAYDYVGLVANTSESQVFIDTVPPKISSSAQVYQAGTKEVVSKISTNSSRVIDVDVEVVVEEDTMSVSASGNFSELDKTRSKDQSGVSADCLRQGWNNTHICTFKNIKLSPASSSTRCTVKATDQMDNSANQSLVLSFTVVNDAGSVTRLGPALDKCYQDTCYLKSGANEITAEISTSSSFNESKVRIEDTQAACTYNQTWVCTADVSSFSGKLNLEGFDDLGNHLTAESDLIIVIDSTPPNILGEINTTPECPTSTETLYITFNVTEAQSLGVTASAYTLGISSDNESKASCVQIGTSNNWACTLSISNLKAQEINTNLNLVVEDFAGNQLIKSVPVSICVELAQVPVLIDKIITKGKLPKIDRRTASRITVKTPLSLEIIKKNKDVEITQTTIVDCSDTPGMAGQAYMMNDEDLKPILIIPLKYDEEWDEDDKVKVNCTQEFMIKHGNKIYTLPEEEHITAELEVFNQPLGTLNESYQKKVDEIKKQIIRLDKQIDKYAKVYTYLGTLCNLAEGIAKVNQVLQSLKSALWGLCVALEPLGIGEVIWNTVNPFLSGIENFVDSFTWPQGWVPTGGNTVGLLLKGTCAIYTCKLYDFNTYVDIGVSIGAYYATRNNIIITDRQCDDEECITVYEDGTIEQVDKETGETQIYNGQTGEVTVYDANGKIKQYISGDGKTVAYYDDNGKVSYTKKYNDDNTYTITNSNGISQKYDMEGNPLTPLPPAREFNNLQSQAPEVFEDPLTYPGPSPTTPSSPSSGNPNPATTNKAVVSNEVTPPQPSKQTPSLSISLKTVQNGFLKAYGLTTLYDVLYPVYTDYTKIYKGFEKGISQLFGGNVVYSDSITGRVTNPFKNFDL
ncbi:hypothetical protein KY341_05260, partial [Candidatus Woesearchaeota archaeon]|nr:hypothetical protein [Candidatus Woesearchaeota archaeon]